MNLTIAGVKQRKVVPARSWQQLGTHYLRVLDDPWYRAIFRLQDTTSTATMDFYRGEGLQTLHVPVTTSSISSPMGLGSDSLPVAVDLFGVRTYLADSMQFMLEYGCRLAERGCYYMMPSFRGEMADETHLCQFYHSEAEIRGGLDDVIALVERYVRALSVAMLTECDGIVHSIAGSVTHVEAVALAGPFPRVSMREAEEMLNGAPSYCERRAPGYTVLTRAGELELIRRFGGPVWLTGFEHLSIPFYQAFSEDGERALAADL
ncbi:MAG TPA: amino acid--tRNA ligase-related protein, partial [Longimicrobiaceae bacterium]|nr:amino acid--tRNA ligase-related protein [Longimicrobiaceae bacterium]